MQHGTWYVQGASRRAMVLADVIGRSRAPAALLRRRSAKGGEVHPPILAHSLTTHHGGAEGPPSGAFQDAAAYKYKKGVVADGPTEGCDVGGALMSTAVFSHALSLATAQPLRVLGETHGVLAIYKPPGLSFHSEGGEDGVMQLVRAMQSSGEIGYSGQLRAVHRLDRPTSGLLLLAKTSEAATVLSNALRERRIAKYYVALSDRRPNKRQGRVRGEMVRARRGNWRLTRSLETSPALTFFISDPLPLLVQPKDAARHAFLLRPITGQTHQLRVALKSLAAPVHGDERYAHAPIARVADRTYLHAAAVRLPRRRGGLPEPALCVEGEPLDIICRPNEGMEFLGEAFGSWWDERLGSCTCEIAGGSPRDENIPRSSWFIGLPVESREAQLWTRPPEDEEVRGT